MAAGGLLVVVSIVFVVSAGGLCGCSSISISRIASLNTSLRLSVGLDGADGGRGVCFCRLSVLGPSLPLELVYGEPSFPELIDSKTQAMIAKRSINYLVKYEVTDQKSKNKGEGKQVATYPLG